MTDDAPTGYFPPWPSEEQLLNAARSEKAVAAAKAAIEAADGDIERAANTTERAAMLLRHMHRENVKAAFAKWDAVLERRRRPLAL